MNSLGYLVLSVLLWGIPLQSPAPPGQANVVPGVNVERLSDRAAVFNIEGGNANVVALKSKKGIVVIDTEGSPALALLLRRKMSEVFGSETFAYVINTHSHGDHTFGNQAFAEAVIVGHENCLAEMAENAKSIEKTSAAVKAGIARMKAGLEKMAPNSDQARALTPRLAYYETMLRGYEDGFSLTPPSVTFNDRLTLDLGDLILDLTYFGTSHSSSHIVIRCPQEGLWLTGDLFTTGEDLYIDSERVAHFARWEACLEKITATEKETRHILAGHGDRIPMDHLKKELAYVRAKQAELAGKESAFFAFRKAFEGQGLEAAVRLLRDLKTKPEKYYILHPELDQYAYRLMLGGKNEEALSIFRTLADLFPDSYLAFDSLGEVYRRKGDKDLAIANFKRSLELNPENNNAAEQLKDLEKKGVARPGKAESAPPGAKVGRPLNVLVLLGEWFGDAYFPLEKELAARGWTMKRVGVDAEYRGCYNKKRDIVLRSDKLIPDMKDFAGYDCLIIPSGPQWRKFNQNPAVLQFVRDAYAAGLIVASFCVGNTTVKAAGLADFPSDAALYPGKVTLVKERLLIGPRGGGPPPGDGFESAPIKEICNAVAAESAKKGDGKV